MHHSLCFRQPFCTISGATYTFNVRATEGDLSIFQEWVGEGWSETVDEFYRQGDSRYLLLSSLILLIVTTIFLLR